MRMSVVTGVVIAGMLLLTGCRLNDAVTDTQSESSPIPLPALNYPWKKAADQPNALVNRIPVPAGYTRVAVENGSFAEWLRFLPLKAGTPPVHLYNGRLKDNQQAHVAVVDLDVGKHDLQQCADAVMRLRGEYFYSRKEYAEIRFTLSNGSVVPFTRWAAGYRPMLQGRRIHWVSARGADSSHAAFRGYMDAVFTYAGTASLSKELKPVRTQDLQIGDVFIQGGFPGHAAIVVDLAKHAETGEKIFLLAQSYMPAQEVHLLKNPGDETRSPWYTLNFGKSLITPEWTFTKDQLKRF